MANGLYCEDRSSCLFDCMFDRGDWNSGRSWWIGRLFDAGHGNRNSLPVAGAERTM